MWWARIGLVASLAVLFGALAPCGAAAQDAGAPEHWALVVASTRDVGIPNARRVAEHASATLSASGETVIASDRAVARLESALSRPYVAAPQELTDRIGQAVEQTLEDVAFGRNQHALDVGQPLLAQLDPYLAALGHTQQYAQDVANLCLYLVRAHLQKRDLGAAGQQVDLCLRLVPDLSPDVGLHPPEVVTLVTTAQERLGRGEGGVLMVHGAPTDPRDCAIRVNGRQVGTTPWQRVTLPPGEYQVQVECREGVPGRIHSVTVPGGAPTRHVVRARFDEVLRTEDGVAFSYASRDALHGRLSGDVAALGTSLAVTRVAVIVSDGAQLVIMAFGVTSPETAELLGSAPVPDPVDARDAIREVLAGRQLDSPVAPSAVATPDESATSAAEAAPAGHAPAITFVRAQQSADAGVIAVGAVITAAGLATLGAGWYFWSELERRREEFEAIPTSMDPGYFDAYQAVLDERLPIWITMGVGAGVTTLGLPFLLPPEDGVPWWSWIFAAAGGGVAAYGVFELTQDGRCLILTAAGTCNLTEQRRTLGGLVLGNALPLISVPIIYAFRSIGQSAEMIPAVSFRADEFGGELLVSGRW